MSKSKSFFRKIPFTYKTNQITFPVTKNAQACDQAAKS